VSGGNKISKIFFSADPHEYVHFIFYSLKKID